MNVIIQLRRTMNRLYSQTNNFLLNENYIKTYRENRKREILNDKIFNSIKLTSIFVLSIERQWYIALSVKI